MHWKTLTFALAFVAFSAATCSAQTRYGNRSNGWPVSGSSYRSGNQTFYSGIGSNGWPVSGYGHTVGNRTYYNGYGR
jgi:hypothetical protein